MPDTSKKAIAVQYQDENGNWRVKLSALRKNVNDPKRQRVFLEQLAKHGRIADACRVAGLHSSAVRKLRDSDSDFDDACIAAAEEYTDRLIAHHQDLVFEGTEKVSYDRNGNIVSTEKVYPIPLIQMELRKHDEAYRDKREVDMKVSGGVLVAPSDVGSIEDWETKFAGGEVIEGEATEVEESSPEDAG